MCTLATIHSLVSLTCGQHVNPVSRREPRLAGVSTGRTFTLRVCYIIHLYIYAPDAFICPAHLPARVKGIRRWAFVWHFDVYWNGCHIFPFGFLSLYLEHDYPVYGVACVLLLTGVLHAEESSAVHSSGGNHHFCIFYYRNRRQCSYRCFYVFSGVLARKCLFTKRYEHALG